MSETIKNDNGPIYDNIISVDNGIDGVSTMIDTYEEKMLDTINQVKDTNKRIDKHISEFNQYKILTNGEKQQFLAEYNNTVNRTEYRMTENRQVIEQHEKELRRVEVLSNIRGHIIDIDNKILIRSTDHGKMEFIGRIIFNVSEVAPLLYMYYKDCGYSVKVIGVFDKLEISWKNPSLPVIWYKIRSIVKRIVSKFPKKESE